MKDTAARVIDEAGASHYTWGAGCDAWRLLDEEQLSVNLESVPSGAEEVRHWHDNAHQFFFILEGQAVIDLPKGELLLVAGQGLHVAPGTIHRFRNPAENPVRFLVISAPSTRADRTNCEPE